MQNFYNEQRCSDLKGENERIILAAAKLSLKTEIKEMKCCCESYPNSDEIGSLEVNFVNSLSQSPCVCFWKIYSLQQTRIWRYLIYLIKLKGMCLHHSFIHLTWSVLRPNVFVVCSSTSSTNRMTVLISINFYRMEDQIPFIYSYFTCIILYRISSNKRRGRLLNLETVRCGAN